MDAGNKSSFQLMKIFIILHLNLELHYAHDEFA
jgi:hypothetical protein